ncbi:MAG: YggS family pyridoxal phosphate-dependent enzyme [Ruminococcaceae bacterium]|nr:YggS family pyridoxal phosphate-dependent enzyme [Oscillospiraceae bacterium]
MDHSYLDRNVAEIRALMEKAKKDAGRDGDEVTLLAAIKSAEVEEIKYIHERLGINDVGENRVQQLLERYEQIKTDKLRVHFIGKLQTNKVKYIIDKVSMIHSLDSLKLAEQINKQAEKHGIVMDVLVEINSGEEENKSGLMPDEVADFCLQLEQFKSINLRGFMTMAPKCEKKDDYCKYFCKTYKLCLDIWTKKLHNIDRPIISMGMSESFCEAIAEGADIVRVGRSMFKK